ncbi:MAG: hypothetical protein CMM56_01385 [Rhodospirillaceae bacterium]|nr:hypothetical protein [Rhodospirillaceae bacterium]|tara:strand:- start:5661 stop:6389 length:729 start_codon:yes stop_codon:yes gene_type:complete
MKILMKIALVFVVLVPYFSQAQLISELEGIEPGFYELILPGTDRRYTIVVPEGYSPGDSVPLVLSLHYGGSVTPFYGRGLLENLIEPALRGLGAILVAPDSAAGDWSNPEAEQHVLQLLTHVMRVYNIDEQKTLVTGYSMGGRGTWYLASRNQDYFRAALPIAGLPESNSGSIDWQIPIYVIHGAQDQVLALKPNQLVVQELQSRDSPVQLVVLDGVGHYEIPRYQEHLAAAVPWIRESWGE